MGGRMMEEPLHMELTLGLPGTSSRCTENGTATCRGKKRGCADDQSSSAKRNDDDQVVGWPPIRAHRRNSLGMMRKMMMRESSDDVIMMGGMSYVKVSVDGAPYLRKIDLKVYGGYKELLKALEHMFNLTIGFYHYSHHHHKLDGYNNNKGSEFAPTYQDKDGDWMLLGDVPWEMFISSCKRLRIMRGSEARGHVMT